MQASEFVRALRGGSVRLGDVTLTRPELNHQDPELNKQPLLVMESMLGEHAIIRAAIETKAEGEHTYHIATDDARLLRLVARLVKTEQSSSVDVAASSYALNQIRVLTFEANCVNGPLRASAHLDFGQAKPIKLTVTTSAEAKALQDFVSVLCTLSGRGATKQSEA